MFVKGNLTFFVKVSLPEVKEKGRKLIEENFEKLKIFFYRFAFFVESIKSSNLKLGIEAEHMFVNSNLTSFFKVSLP